MELTEIGKIGQTKILCNTGHVSHLVPGPIYLGCKVCDASGNELPIAVFAEITRTNAPGNSPGNGN